MAKKQLFTIQVTEAETRKRIYIMRQTAFSGCNDEHKGNDTTAIVPDWTQTSNQPTITLTLSRVVRLLI